MAQKYTKSTSTTTGERSKNRPIKQAGYSSFHLHAKRDRKQSEAFQRQLKYDALTLKEKIASCVPNGSTKQRNKLQLLKSENPVQPATVTETKKPVKAKKTVKS